MTTKELLHQTLAAPVSQSEQLACFQTTELTSPWWRALHQALEDLIESEESNSLRVGLCDADRQHYTGRHAMALEVQNILLSAYLRAHDPPADETNLG